MPTKDEIQLAWSDFQINATQSFQCLRTNQDFSDITLVSEENHLIKAHRVILSAGSSFFKHVLTILEAHPNPLFYLKNVSSSDLSCLLDFIYCGEAKVPQKNLETFLKNAKDLGVFGLHIESEPNKQIKYRETIVEDLEIKHDSKLLDISQEMNGDYRTNNTDTLTIPNEGNGDDYFSKPGEEITDEHFSKVMNRMWVKNGNVWTCTECGQFKAKNKGHILDHVEIHIVGLQYPCDICSKIFKTSKNIKQHISIHHREDKLAQQKALESVIKKKHPSTVWDFFQLSESSSAICNLCSWTTKNHKISKMNNHIFSCHKGTEEEEKLQNYLKLSSMNDDVKE